MKLIDEWKHAWRMFSVQAGALGVAIPLVYIQLPEEFRASIPHSWVMIATGITAACGLAGRLIHQPAIEKPAGEAPK